MLPLLGWVVRRPAARQVGGRGDHGAAVAGEPAHGERRVGEFQPAVRTSDTLRQLGGPEGPGGADSVARTLLWIFMALYFLAFPWFFSRALAGAHRLRGARAAAPYRTLNRGLEVLHAKKSRGLLLRVARSVQIAARS